MTTPLNPKARAATAGMDSRPKEVIRYGELRTIDGMVNITDLETLELAKKYLKVLEKEIPA